MFLLVIRQSPEALHPISFDWQNCGACIPSDNCSLVSTDFNWLSFFSTIPCFFTMINSLSRRHYPASSVALPTFKMYHDSCCLISHLEQLLPSLVGDVRTLPSAQSRVTCRPLPGAVRWLKHNSDPRKINCGLYQVCQLCYDMRVGRYWQSGRHSEQSRGLRKC